MPNRVVKPKNYKPVGRPEVPRATKKEEARRKLFMMSSKAKEKATADELDTEETVPSVEQRADNVEANDQLFEISYDAIDTQAAIKKKQEELEIAFQNKFQQELAKQQELLQAQVEQKLQERLQQELAKQQELIKQQEESMKQLYSKKQEELKQEQAKLLQSTTAAAQQINKLSNLEKQASIARRRKGILG